MKVKRDDRIDLKGNDLQINSVGIDDGGNYSCEIEADSEYPIVLTHTVEVLSKCTFNMMSTVQILGLRNLFISSF